MVDTTLSLLPPVRYAGRPVSIMRFAHDALLTLLSPPLGWDQQATADLAFPASQAGTSAAQRTAVRAEVCHMNCCTVRSHSVVKCFHAANQSATYEIPSIDRTNRCLIISGTDFLTPSIVWSISTTTHSVPISNIRLQSNVLHLTTTVSESGGHPTRLMNPNPSRLRQS